MTSPTAANQSILSEQDAKDAGQTDAQIWIAKIEQALDDEDEWRKQARVAVAVYEATKEIGSLQSYYGKPIFNIFHSNVQTLEPAVYNSTPIPDVRRKFGDNDEVARLASQICERALAASLDAFNFDERMTADVRDAVTAGRGISRVRYVPYLRPSSEAIGATDIDGTEFEAISHEEVMTEHVGWDTYVQGPARDWDRVPFIAFKHDLTKDEVERLLKANAKLKSEEVKTRLEALPFATTGLDRNRDDDEKAWKGVLKTIPVWEVWDKDRREVLFVTDKDKTFPLCVLPDPLKVSGFFPVPQPIQQVRRVSSLIPLCPHNVYADLIAEIDDTTRRIQATVKDMRVRAISDPKLKQDIEQLADADDNDVISANAADIFSTSGQPDINKLVLWWPIQQDVEILKTLMEHRDDIKGIIYEVTGLSDVIRGESDRSQTATEVNTKATWGSQRIQKLQQEVARYAKDMFRIMAEVIFNKFQEQTIRNMTLLPETVDVEAISNSIAAQFQQQQPANENATGASAGQQSPPNGASPVAPVGQTAPNPQLVAQQLQQAQQQAVAQARQQAEAKFKAALALMKSQFRFFRVDIETDSTIKANLVAMQEQTNNFVGMTSQFVQAATGLAQIAPPMLAPFIELYTKVAGRSFKLGKGADDILEKITEAAQQAVEQGLITAQSGPSQQEQQAQAQQQAHEAAMQQRQQDHERAMQATKQIEAQTQQIHDQTIAATTRAQQMADATRDALSSQQNQEHEQLMASHDKLMAFLDMHKDAFGHESQTQLIALKDAADALKHKRSMEATEQKAKAQKKTAKQGAA